MLGKYTGKEFQRLLGIYLSYLETYKKLNNGSAEGATPFGQFYVLMTYTTKYNDNRVLASLGYK